MTINGIKLYFEREGRGTPLLLINGYTSNLKGGDLIRPLFAKHFDLILLDNRGAGRSEVPQASWSIQTMADDVKALMDHLDIPKAHILGHSMGGAIAQTFAHTYPHCVDKLILANTFIKVYAATAFSMIHGLKLRKAQIDQTLLLESHFPWLYSNNFLADSKRIAHALHVCAENPYPISVDGQEKQLNAILQFDSNSWFHNIKVPTLVIEGEEDITCPHDSKRLAKGILGAKLESLPNQAHMAHLEDPEKFASIILSFLKR